MEKFSKKVVARLCTSGAIQEDDREVYEYSLGILLVGISHSLTVFLIGLLLGMFVESLVLFASFFLIRKFAGGYHASKHWQCYLFTIVTVAGALLLSRVLLTQANMLFYVVLGVSAAIIFVFAPVGHPNKPLSAKEKKVYRLISWALCCALAALAVIMFLWVAKSIGLSIGMGLVVGAFTLLLAKADELRKNIAKQKNDLLVHPHGDTAQYAITQ